VRKAGGAKSPLRSRASRRRQQRLSREAKALLGIGGVLALGAILFFVFFAPSSSRPDAGQTGQAQSAALLVREDSYQKGSPDAKVTLVEFLDFECEACAAMYPTVERVRQEYGDQVNFVVRHFPIHQNSVPAAKAAEAAGRQGKFWEMYAILFENQQEWGEKSEPQTAVFMAYAERIGLDMERFRSDFSDPTLDAKVGRDRADGVSAGVRGTPTFFINGVNAGNVMPYDEIKGKLDAALK
jgi:protein-disulfide isomerase